MKSLKGFRNGIKTIGVFFKSTRVLIGLVSQVVVSIFFRDKTRCCRKLLG